jgi:hypothetical protein
MARRVSLILLALGQSLFHASLASAAPPVAGGVDPAEVRRGFILVGARASDEPALRLESQTHEPSMSFRVGAALGAWISAAAALDYDLKTPSGDGGDEEAIGVDCYDERVAFVHLETGLQALGLTPNMVTAAAGALDPAVSPAWIARRREGAPARCR